MVGAEAGLGLAPGGLVQGQGSGVVSGGRKEVGEVVAVADGVAVGGPRLMRSSYRYFSSVTAA